MRSLVAVVTLGLMLVRATSAGAQPASIKEEAQTFAVGDTWSFKFSVEGVDRGEYTETVSEIAADIADLLTEGERGKSVVTYDVKQHRFLVRYAIRPDGSRGKVMSDVTQNQPPIRFPFGVDDSWPVDYRFGHVSVEMKARVVGKETLKTKAGEFETYKVELSGFWRDLNNLAAGAGRTYETYWYAAVAKRWVRREIRQFGTSYNHMSSVTIYSRTDEVVAYRLAR